MTVDPITLAVIDGALEGVAVEMGHKLMRMAHSSIIRESEDFGAAILDAAGNQLCESARSTPLQSGPIPGYLAGIRRLLAERGEDWEPGDVVMHNDPYAGASHGPDVAFCVPVFRDGVLVAFAVTTAHHLDIGALAPGSSGIVDALDAYAEGLRFRALKVIARGVPNRALWTMVADNLRTSDTVIGDMQAQIAAAEIGARRYLELSDRFGFATLRAAQDELMAAAERRMRAAIAAVPDGTYRATTMLDGFLDDPEPRRRDLTLAVAITVAGERLHVDLAGTSPQVDDRPVNMPFAGTVDCAVWLTLKSILLDTAVHGRFSHNSGLVRPITIAAPLGTLANPEFPAPTIARACAGNQLADTVMKAMAQAVPERVAAGIGAPKGIAFTGMQDGRHWVHLEVIEGAYGGRHGKDGMDAIDTLYVNTRNNPIEETEARKPLRVWRYELREDAVGAGRWRGGLGAVREFEYLADGGVSVEGEGHKYPPWPVGAGQPGRTAALRLADGGTAASLPSKLPYRTVRRGTRLVVVSGAGAGYGDPLLRDAQCVAADVADGMISRATALAEYGVALTADGRVDAAATAAARAPGAAAAPCPVRIALEPLDAAAFAPFGTVIGAGLPAPPPGGPGTGRPLPFAGDDAAMLLDVHFAHVPWRFDLVECHAAITQAFVPYDGAPAVMVVGAPGPAPRAAALRAFLIERQGVVLHLGTWHSLSRFPTRAGGSRFVMVTGRETERELRAHEAGGAEPRLTRFARLDAPVEVYDPDRLAG